MHFICKKGKNLEIHPSFGYSWANYEKNACFCDNIDNMYVLTQKNMRLDYKTNLLIEKKMF